MKLIIDIPDITYNTTLERKQLAICNDNDIYEWIKNGTPIPDNATNGDVIKALFKPNWIRRMDDVVREEYEFNADWWNAPYQKGGKE